MSCSAGNIEVLIHLQPAVGQLSDLVGHLRFVGDSVSGLGVGEDGVVEAQHKEHLHFADRGFTMTTLLGGSLNTCSWPQLSLVSG